MWTLKWEQTIGGSPSSEYTRIPRGHVSADEQQRNHMSASRELACGIQCSKHDHGVHALPRDLLTCGLLVCVKVVVSRLVLGVCRRPPRELRRRSLPVHGTYVVGCTVHGAGSHQWSEGPRLRARSQCQCSMAKALSGGLINIIQITGLKGVAFCFVFSRHEPHD